ncbi:MAG: class I SAM-dependent methyltransferase [Candidatus Schekmanbacteria bacterium]|nr:class I SAM-dependent methyltransferase [Candidatus Schekmanbacteria bacterium]
MGGFWDEDNREAPSLVALYARGAWCAGRALLLNVRAVLSAATPRLWAAYALLNVAFPASSAYRICHWSREADVGAGPGELTYGETLFGSAIRILRHVQIRPGERVLELGAGRGIVALVAAIVFRADVHAFDVLWPFVRRGRLVARILCLSNLHWHRQDLATVSLENADVVYLAGTCLQEARRELVADHVQALKPGARIASVSEPIASVDLEELGELELDFSWGKSRVYFQQRRARTPEESGHRDDETRPRRSTESANSVSFRSILNEASSRNRTA